jgi:hypothetical protein
MYKTPFSSVWKQLEKHPPLRARVRRYAKQGRVIQVVGCAQAASQAILLLFLALAYELNPP